MQNLGTIISKMEVTRGREIRKVSKRRYKVYLETRHIFRTSAYGMLTYLIRPLGGYPFRYLSMRNCSGMRAYSWLRRACH